MARISPIVNREELAPEHQPVYDAIKASRGGVGGPFGLLLHNPPLANLVAELGAHIRFQSHLSRVDQELAIITVGREMECHTEWSGHVRLARQVGVREEAIDTIRSKRAPAGLTEDEAAVVRYVLELIRDRTVTAATYGSVLHRYNVATLVELTTLVGYYVLLAGLFSAFEVGPPPNAEPM